MTLDITIATTNGPIYGVWYEASSDGATDSWVLKREPCCPEGWGQRLEFQENGEFVDSYSAPCGNDGGFHHWSGKWKWNEDQRLLVLQVENCPDYSDISLADFVKPSVAYKSGVEFFILELTDQRLRLQPSNPTVQLYA